MSDRPNIVFIFPDQLRGDSLGCVGNPAVITPHIDRLAAEGVIFTRCYTSSPLCQPARASMMTGRYVHEHGVWGNVGEADRHGPSHVRNIRDAGYRTALIGKTHLYQHEGSVHTSLNVHKLVDWGFEDIHEIFGPVGSASLDSPHTDSLKGAGHFNTFRAYMGEYVRRVFNAQASPWDWPAFPIPTEFHADSYIGRKAVEWIRKYHDDQPFYLQVLFTGPHDPFDSAAAYRAMYDPAKVPLCIMEPPDPNGRPPYVERLVSFSGLQEMDEEKCRRMRVNYYAKITLIDEWIGRIVGALEERNLLGNTWIVLNSDHGDNLGDHRLLHKNTYFESSIHVPLIVRPAGQAPGWKTTALADHPDVAATLIDIAGAKPLETSAGTSLRPKVEAGPGAAGAQEGREAVFSELAGYSAVRTNRYKMVVETKTGKVVELYDLAADPKELRNLRDDPAHESVRRDLQERHLTPFLRTVDREALEGPFTVSTHRGGQR